MFKIQLDFLHPLWFSRNCEVSLKDYPRNLHNRLTALQNRKQSHTLAKNLQPTAPAHCPINLSSLNVFKNHISNEKKKKTLQNKIFAHLVMPRTQPDPTLPKGSPSRATGTATIPLPQLQDKGTQPGLKPPPHPAKSSNPVLVMSAFSYGKGRWIDRVEEHPDCQKAIRGQSATVSPLS